MKDKKAKSGTRRMTANGFFGDSFEVEAPDANSFSARSLDSDVEVFEDQMDNPLAKSPIAMGWEAMDDVSDEEEESLPGVILRTKSSLESIDAGIETGNKRLFERLSDAVSEEKDDSIFDETNVAENLTHASSPPQDGNDRLREFGFMHSFPRAKHSFPPAAVLSVKMFTCATGLVAVLCLVFAIHVYSCGEHETVATGFIAVASSMGFFSVVGLYGALRVRADVEAETGVGGVALEDEDSTMNDGLDTVGQQMLGVYFMASTVGILLWSVLGAQALSLADNNVHGVCEDQRSYMIALGAAGIGTSVFYCAQVVKIKRILSSFIMVKTFAQ
eukprot:SAG11_NODE_5388_length_1575_cov_0.974255_2_plen_331_part_00